jgi:hypothetical protein
VWPVAVTWVSVSDELGGYSFVLPGGGVLSAKDLAQTNKLFNTDAYYAWVLAQGGAVAVSNGDAVTQLILQGERTSPVTILGMGVEKQCGAPLGGVLYWASPQGEATPAMLGFNLDQHWSIARPVHSGSGANVIAGSGNYFDTHSISLAQNEQMAFTVWTRTTDYCQYRLTLKVLSAGQQTTETIGDSTQIGADAPPFRVTSIGPRYQAVFAYTCGQDWGWKPTNLQYAKKNC